ncbi:MAG: hypothetical protein H6735_10090 [Alphaproteobacteria bacterium]|nr:hypothetical protein [Alphaproteobacteria bacterium]
MLLSVLLGCEPQEWPLDEPPTGADTTVRGLWQSNRRVGAKVTLSPVVVLSQRAWPGDRFFASDPAGGPASAVEIGLGDVVATLPEVGTVVSLTGVLERSTPLRVRVERQDQILELWAGEPPLPWPGELDANFENALVRVDGLTVTSGADPLGRASTDGVGLGGLFGVTPGYGREGDLVGIYSAGRVSARSPADWSGELEGDPPVPATIAMLDDLPGGMPVTLAKLAVVTPISADGRWAVLQDGSGAGLWLDLQLAGPSTLPRRPATWTGELRRTSWGANSLRVWEVPRVVGGLRPAVVREVDGGGALVDATLVRIEVSGLGPVDAWGDRTTAGPTLDDAFLELGSLPDPVTVLGVAVGANRVAPLPER